MRRGPNPICRGVLIERLARHDHGSVRAAAAASLNCPPAVLHCLSFGPRPLVRLAAVSNPACPVDALDTLCRVVAGSRRDGALRAAADRNPNCPVSILDTLGGDSDPGVRIAVSSREAALWRNVREAPVCGGARLGPVL